MTKYEFDVPDNVLAPDNATTVVLQLPERAQDFINMEVPDLAFQKMLVAPECKLNDCHLTFYNFVVSTADQLLGEIQGDAFSAFDNRKLEEDGTIKVTYQGHQA